MLDVDAMFFHSAVNSLTEAESQKTVAEDMKSKLLSIPYLREYETWDLDDEIDVRFSKEEVDLVEDLKAKARISSSKFLQAAATTHIFCVAALEAHVNKTASKLLESKTFEHFEKLSIEGKWMILPQLLGKERLKTGHQPFQDFAALIKIRNKLVHYKGKKIPYFAADPGDVYGPLGLSVEAAAKSLEATKNMIRVQAEILGREIPKWIEDNISDYLNVEIHIGNVKTPKGEQ